MSVDQTIYVGVYVTLEPKNAKTVVIDLCKDHNVPKGAKFCPECGRNKSVRYTTHTQNAPDNWEFEPKVAEGKSFDYWLTKVAISNRPSVLIVNSSQSKFGFYISEGSDTVKPLTDVIAKGLYKNSLKSIKHN